MFEDFTGRRIGGSFLVTVGREMWNCGAWHKKTESKYHKLPKVKWLFLPLSLLGRQEKPRMRVPGRRAICRRGEGGSIAV